MKNLMSDAWLDGVQAMHAEITRRLDAFHALGFRPAFYDYATGTIYPSRHPDGRAAGFHDLDGLPECVVASRTDAGRVITVKPSLKTGFERNGFFFTHQSAIRAAREWRGGSKPS